ncbi:ATPase [Romboutsia ilealis]|uniref:ATPase n=1 Tax=Romboutsia ilealis TaxID=1115758 RepID=UPI0026765DD4|nr:ATPase [Romboutsia ilealis]
MQIIRFSLEERENCFISLAHVFGNEKARKEYVTLQLDNKIEFPSNDLEIISRILSNYDGDEDILLNYDVARSLNELKVYSDITDYAHSPISKTYYKAFTDKIKNNRDTISKVSLIDYSDSKQAFISYLGGNFKALINSNNEYKFVKWNGKAWIKYTEEEARIIYNDFINQCEIELEDLFNGASRKECFELEKKIRSWDNKNRVNEALDKVRRDKKYIINLKTCDKNENIICSQNGFIINLNNGKIKKSCRNDLILNTSKYELVDREEAEKFINENLKLYKDILGEERLNFMFDLIAYKMLGKNLQLAIFMIGSGATGKSTFKNIIKDLFEDNITNIPYEYFTLSHRGNDDKSRDDLLVSLNNKLWGVSSEGEEDYIISQAKFKTILSNSTEMARRTRGNLVEVNLQKLDLLIDTNTIPKFGNFDDAVNRRLLFVKFINKIPLEKRNSNFYREYIKPNFDYIFSYFIYRAIDMIGKELKIPNCVKEDTQQNVKEMDSLLKFSLDVIAPLDGFYVDCEKVERAYIKLCNDEDLVNIIPKNIIGTARAYNFIVNKLKDFKGYEEIKRDRVSGGSSNNKKYVIRGIAFIGEEDQCPFN